MVAATKSKSKSKTKAGSEYDVHPGVAMVVDWIDALKAKTGRSLDEWMKFIKKEGPASEEARRVWLKEQHKLGTNSAWWLAERSVGKGADEDTPEGYLQHATSYVKDMYEDRAALKPLHDKLIELARALGGDIKVCPCKTIVSIYRENVIAQIRPSTRTRIDFGLCLTPLVKEGKKLPARLIGTGGFKKKDRITHKIEVTSAKDIDTELERWLAKAYQLNA
ncbi:MAG: DUF5655 domain-containing protein [Phycisphaerales bacterium]